MYELTPRYLICLVFSTYADLLKAMKGILFDPRGISRRGMASFLEIFGILLSHNYQSTVLLLKAPLLDFSAISDLAEWSTTSLRNALVVTEVLRFVEVPRIQDTQELEFLRFLEPAIRLLKVSPQDGC